MKMNWIDMVNTLAFMLHNQKWLTLFDDLHKENIDEVEFGMDTDLLREIGSLD